MPAEILRRHPARQRGAAGSAGAGHDQRHFERAAVDEDAVPALAVLAERLAVIPHRGDEVIGAAIRQRGEQPADLAIDGGELRVVGIEVGVLG